MKEKNEENMIKESEILNMGFSLLWFFQLFSYSHVATKDWHLSWSQSTHNLTAVYTMEWLRCRISFSLLHYGVTCLRGAHSIPGSKGSAMLSQSKCNSMPPPPQPTLSTSTNSSAMQPDALAQSIASAGSCRKLLQQLLHLHTVLRHTASNPGFQSPLGVAS